MSLVFDVGSCSSPISDDYCMEENRLSNLEGLPQASWQGCYLDQVNEREISPSWFTGSCDSPDVLFEFPTLPAGNCKYFLNSGVVDDSKSKKAVEPQCGLLEDVAAAGKFSSQVYFPIVAADWSTNGSDSYGASESLKQEGFSPPYQLCNQFRDLGVRKLDGSPENGISAVEETIPGCGKNLHQGYWQGNLTEGPQFRGIEGRGETKYCGKKRCCSKAGPDDLLSSLRSLLSVLKNYVERDQISQTKMQELRKRKEAFQLQKQQYQNEHKRQRVLDR